jgi:hypothetical protein
MSDWQFAQTSPSQRLAQIHRFSILKQQDGKDIEFIITIREYLTPVDPMMKFYAESDKDTNQKLAIYTPTGWGPTLLKALSNCIKEIERFPYQPE